MLSLKILETPGKRETRKGRREDRRKGANEIVRKNVKTTVNLILSAVMLAVAILGFGFSAFGWFSRNDTVSGSGMSVQVVCGQVDIFAKVNGTEEKVGYDEHSSDMDRFDNGADGNKNIRPGSSGEIGFTVTKGQLETYGFSYRIEVKNNEYADENEGFLPGVSDEGKEQALAFINSHLLFFTRKNENGSYGGWVKSGEKVSCSVKEKENASVTLYWVWIPLYGDIFGDDNALIEEKDREEIKKEYSVVDENGVDKKKEMFSNGDATEEGYNEADFRIGRTLSRICFCLDVRGD